MVFYYLPDHAFKKDVFTLKRGGSIVALFPKYRCLLIAAFFVPVFLFPVFLHGQNDNYPDTVRVDTEPEGEEPQENYQEHLNYFIRRDLQANGGGPDSVEMRQLPDSTLKRMKQSDDFWYADYIFKKEKKKKEPEDGTSFLQPFLWILIIGGFAAFLVVYLSNSNVSLFRRKNMVTSLRDEEDFETDNIFEINYQKEIDKAVNSRNYRQAIRLMFLRALKTLSEKKLIDYRTGSTNFDYILQVQGSAYYDDFFRLTRNYEYTWYGHFDIDKDKFQVIRNDFENFEDKLKEA